MKERNGPGKQTAALTVPVREYRSLIFRNYTETHLFSEVGRIIASELEPTELIRKIMMAISKAVAFDDASVYTVKKDLSGLLPVFFLDPLLKGSLLEPIYFDNGAPGQIAASGEVLFLNDCSSYGSFLHHPDEPARPGSYMGIPLKNDVRIVGVMGFSRTAPGTFTVASFDLLRTLSFTISAGLEKAELFKRTLEISRVDELTGLLNYRVLLEQLEMEINRQVRTGRDFSFIMIDIDDFKRVNDRYGHLEGSRVLAQLGGLLRSFFRTGSTDTCFRYGGEEFSILLGETNFEGAMVVAERVRQKIEEYPFTLKALHPHEPLTVSIGVSIKQKGDGKNVSGLIHEADVALYQSKSLGKNRVTGYSADMNMPGSGYNREQGIS